MSFKYKSNKDNVLNALTNAQKLALEAVGMLVEAEAKLRTPVDTGTLRRSISNQVDESDKRVDIGSNCEYAVYVHEGTSTQKAQPFIKDGVMENIAEIKK